MVAHFTVYLPPPVLSPLSLDPKFKGDLPIKLHQLPPSSHNRSQSLDPRRHNLLLSTQGSSRAGHSIRPIARDYGRVQGDDVGSMEAGGDPKGKRKVSQGVESTQDSTISTRARKKVQRGTSLDNGHAQLDGSTAQRRSRRLSRANDSLLGSHLAIGLDTTESFLSLNTTISDTSLLPPTNSENSVYNLPQWHIPLSKLVTLQSLLQASPRRQSTYGKTRKFVDQGGGMGGQKVNLIVCVTAVEAVVLRQRKEEKARGREGTLYIGKWSVVAPPTATNGGGNQAEVGCEVKLWDSCAREWGDDTVRRGDVVMLENAFDLGLRSHELLDAEFRPASEKDKAHIVLSPSLLSTSSPRPTILYRTLPRYQSRLEYVYQGNKQAGARHMEPEDRALRPDLRLARSDPGLRRVVDVARWFAGWVEGEPPL